MHDIVWLLGFQGEPASLRQEQTSVSLTIQLFVRDLVMLSLLLHLHLCLIIFISIYHFIKRWGLAGRDRLIYLIDFEQEVSVHVFTTSAMSSKGFSVEFFVAQDALYIVKVCQGELNVAWNIIWTNFIQINIEGWYFFSTSRRLSARKSPNGLIILAVISASLSRVNYFLFQMPISFIDISSEVAQRIDWGIRLSFCPSLNRLNFCIVYIYVWSSRGQNFQSFMLDTTISMTWSY